MVNPLLCREPVAPKLFALPASKIHAQQRKERLRSQHNRRLSQFIDPKNAAVLLDAVPEREGEASHAVLRGDFVLADFLPMLNEQMGGIDNLLCTTLSINLKNCEIFEQLFPSLQRVRLLISSYFFTTDKAKATDRISRWSEWRGKGLDIEVAHCRQHTKLILAETGDAKLVIETSANLRSSGCLEQLAMFRDAELFDFHATWINEVFGDAVSFFGP